MTTTGNTSGTSAAATADAVTHAVHIQGNGWDIILPMRATANKGGNLFPTLRDGNRRDVKVTKGEGGTDGGKFPTSATLSTVVDGKVADKVATVKLTKGETGSGNAKVGAREPVGILDGYQGERTFTVTVSDLGGRWYIGSVGNGKGGAATAVTDLSGQSLS